MEIMNEFSYVEKCAITDSLPKYKMIYEMPNYIGYYKIGNYHIMFEKRPTYLKRFFMNLLLGFKWYNNEISKI